MDVFVELNIVDIKRHNDYVIMLSWKKHIGYNLFIRHIYRDEMKREEIINNIIHSDIFKKWHWFRWHFQPYLYHMENDFAKAIVDALTTIDNKIQDYAITTILRMASISGKEKDLQHYNQLLQLCSEIYILQRAVIFYSQQEASFLYEPHAEISKKNPEVIIKTNSYSLGIEVKQPSLVNHIQVRQTKPIQVPTRVDNIFGLRDSFGEENIILPRDNAVKDFLISADKKFQEFKTTKNFYSILFIVWDDFIYEPISALIGQPSGLLLKDSFARNTNGEALTYDNIDAVFIDRHLTNLILATRDQPLIDNKENALDYGEAGIYPWKVIIPIKKEVRIPFEVCECFQVTQITPSLGAEYCPSDIVFWSPILIK